LKEFEREHEERESESEAELSEEGRRREQAANNILSKYLFLDAQ